MKSTLTELTQNLPGPTQEDLQRAEREILALDPSSPRFHVSKNPEVFKFQVRCWAYSYVVARAKVKLHLVPPREKTEEEIEAEGIAKQVAHDYEVTRLMMGKENAFSEVSFYAPSTIQTSVVKYLMEVLPYSDKPNCVLLGGTGSGKTFGAIGYVAQRASVSYPSIGESVVNAAYVTAYKLSMLLSRRQFEELERLEKVKYLIVDDLGAEPEGFKGKDFIAHFENLFMTRHQHHRVTIITSNSTKAQIIEAYGDRLISRLRETGAMFETSDPDMRVGKQ